MAWLSMYCAAWSWARFNQVPSVAPRILPDRDAPIGFVAWHLFKDGTRCDKLRLFRRKVIVYRKSQTRPPPCAQMALLWVGSAGCAKTRRHPPPGGCTVTQRFWPWGTSSHRVQPKPLQKKAMASSWSGTIKEIAPSCDFAGPCAVAGSVTRQPHFGQSDACDLFGNRIH